MTIRLRLLDKKTKEVVPVQRIDFKDGHPITVFVDGQEWSAAKYEIQVGKEGPPMVISFGVHSPEFRGEVVWEPVDLVFEEGA